MGGVIGAMSTKFTITAGVLLLSARVGNHPVSAALDPAVETTLISPEAAGPGRNLSDGASIDRAQWIGLDAHMLRIRSLKVSKSIAQQSVLGADVLKAAPLLLDFKSHRLQVLEPGPFRRATSKMEALPITLSSDGCLTIAGVDESGASVSAALIARPQGSDEGTPAIFRAGSIQLAASQPGQAICRSSKLQISWSAFEGSDLIFDMGRDQIWISRKP